MSAVLNAPAYTVRAMQEDDVDAVMVIEESVYPFPWTAHIFKDCIRVGYICRLCEKDGEIMAYAVLSTGAGDAHLLNLCVSPAYRQQGIGRAMLRKMITLARERVVQTVFLEVRPSNHQARALYAQSGFNEIGTRKEYYPADKGREDALILALEL